MARYMYDRENCDIVESRYNHYFAEKNIRNPNNCLHHFLCAVLPCARNVSHPQNKRLRGSLRNQLDGEVNMTGGLEVQC